MMNYHEKPLCNEDVRMSEKCYGYSSADSHYGIVAGAKGGYCSFNDPRPGKEGKKLSTERFFINDSRTEVKGVNLYDKQGNYACSYVGESFDDITQQNYNDIRENRSKQCENLNIKYDSKREAIRPSGIGSFVRAGMKTTYDTSKIERELPYTVKGIELKTKEDNPELYDKYNGLVNSSNGHSMTCEAIYTNKPNNRIPTEQVQYVEFRDDETKDKYHYISSYEKSVDEQIMEDNTRSQEETIKKENGEKQTINYTQGVKR